MDLDSLIVILPTKSPAKIKEWLEDFTSDHFYAEIDDFRGCWKNMPVLSTLFMIFVLSMASIPPLAGFIGKFYIFASLIQGGSSFYWLVVIGGINSVISLYYYLRVVKVMYFEGDRKESLLFPPKVLSGMFLVTAVPTLILGIYWVPIAEWIQSSLVFFIQTI